ncbi:hypothetical protein NHX12_011253 [Muraenolepis orangiensis]|uniref:Uncharacterized protein n=1 Tax=Muraenolepis orangiensis TaxID=630683 RepID=A0A9Q0DHC1_9TELE|nr:hypothetical protein NHX12_011253 [Muraenolepis orangiensis]
MALLCPVANARPGSVTYLPWLRDGHVKANTAVLPGMALVNMTRGEREEETEACYGRSSTETEACYGRSSTETEACYGRSSTETEACYGRSSTETEACYGRLASKTALKQRPSLRSSCG